MKVNMNLYSLQKDVVIIVLVLKIKKNLTLIEMLFQTSSPILGHMIIISSSIFLLCYI